MLDVIGLLKEVGVGVVAFATVIYMVRECNKEREALTDKFIAILSETIKGNVSQLQSNTDTMKDVVSVMHSWVGPK